MKKLFTYFLLFVTMDSFSQNEFAAALKLGGKLFNVLLEEDDLLVGIRIS